MDEEDLRRFLAADYRRLVAAFTPIAGSMAAAEDAVEEALARAWERARRGETFDDLTVWVAVVARNLLRTRFRRLAVERRARRRLAAAERPVAGPEAGFEHTDVLEAVAALPRRQREAVGLHYLADLAVADVARATGTSEGAVKVQLHRARRSLAASLQADAPEEVDEVAER